MTNNCPMQCSSNRIAAIILLAVTLLCSVATSVNAGNKNADTTTSVAILDFELNDLTLTPRLPSELRRTASIAPELARQLATNRNLRVLQTDPEDQAEANKAFGYLFQHPKIVAKLGAEQRADWVVVGRLHKPSDLFAYMMVRLIHVDTQQQRKEFIVEVKGPSAKVTTKGVERLAKKINAAITKRTNS